METATEVFAYVNNAFFVILALLTARRWRKTGGSAAMFAMLTFAVLAVIAIAGVLTPEDPAGSFWAWIQKLTIAVLLLFPYFLYRFATSFTRAPRGLDVAAALATAGLIVLSLLSPSFPEPGASRSTVFQVYLFALLAQWTFLSLTAAVRLWRAGSGQPGVARKRMRLLALGATAMNTALLIAGLAPTSGAEGIQLVTQALALASVLLFFFGFEPPASLRVAWRRNEEEALREAVRDAVSATQAEDLTSRLLPHIAGMVGAKHVELLDRSGEVVAAFDAPVAQPEEVRSGQEIRRELPDGSLVLTASTYTPFFGEEEVRHAEFLGSLLSIAAERARLSKLQDLILQTAYDREREARLVVEKMNKEMESFVYTVSHDLNSPLVSISGFLDFFKKDYGASLPEQGRFFLERMSGSARYMQALIRDLLEFSRVGRLETKLERVDLGELVPVVVEEVVGARPQLKVDFENLPVVSMNEHRAQQLFANLLHNAARYAGPEPSVEIRVVDTIAGRVCLSVSDNGPGIPPDQSQKVFDVFQRLHDRQSEEGTGIGLAICQRIVESTGGEIWLAESPVGADFRMTLPLLNHSSRSRDEHV